MVLAIVDIPCRSLAQSIAPRRHKNQQLSVLNLIVPVQGVGMRLPVKNVELRGVPSLGFKLMRGSEDIQSPSCCRTKPVLSCFASCLIVSFSQYFTWKLCPEDFDGQS